MKFISLSDGESTWYLPKGLPGALAIVTRQRVIYCIKSNNLELPYHFMNPDVMFCKHALTTHWQTLFNYDTDNLIVPTGYLYRYRHIYWNDFFTISEIRDQIKEDFTELEKVFYKNKGLKFYLKAKWREFIDRILP